MKNLDMKFDEYIPLRDIVFKTLREAIITGELEPGERLMEIKLANKMGVSRTPVREAIRKLELEGLVIMNARKGAVVAPINEKDLKEILEIRKSLESLACQLACSKASPEQIAALRKKNSIIAGAVEDNDIVLITQTDVEFHDDITDLTGNGHLIDILHQLKEHLYRYRLEYIKDMKNRYAIVDDHNKIIDAIEAGNSKVACREVERHIEFQEKFILNTLEKARK